MAKAAETQSGRLALTLLHKQIYEYDRGEPLK